MQGEGNNQNKKTSSPVNATNPPSRSRAKGRTRPRNPWKRILTKSQNNKNPPLCPMYGFGHNMNSCKIMQAQSKAMKSTWLTARGGGAGHVRFQGAKKRPAEGEDMNDLVTNAVKEVLKSKKRVKYNAEHKSGSEEEQ